MNKNTIIIIFSSLVLVAILLVLGAVTKKTPTGINAPILPPAAAAWMLGKETAKAELVEYGDFQCPACAAYYPLVKQLAADFPDNLKISYAHFPLINFHQNALPAAYAAEAAGRQGKFWDMADLLFERQSEWSPVANPISIFQGYAGEIGLNAVRFAADSSSPEVKEKVEAQRQAALNAKLTGTPTFFLNGKKIENPRSYQEFKTLIEKTIK